MHQEIVFNVDLVGVENTYEAQEVRAFMMESFCIC